jgi:hypothetical protein
LILTGIEDAIKTELKQFSDFRTFRVLDPDEAVPSGYGKKPLVFDVEYYIRHKARLVLSDSWTASEREDIYSGAVGMENVRKPRTP